MGKMGFLVCPPMVSELEVQNGLLGTGGLLESCSMFRKGLLVMGGSPQAFGLLSK